MENLAPPPCLAGHPFEFVTQLFHLPLEMIHALAQLLESAPGGLRPMRGILAALGLLVAFGLLAAFALPAFGLLATLGLLVALVPLAAFGLLAAFDLSALPFTFTGIPLVVVLGQLPTRVGTLTLAPLLIELGSGAERVDQGLGAEALRSAGEFLSIHVFQNEVA